MTNSNNDILQANCIFAIGSNTTETHPVIGFNIKKATRSGTKLIIANPRHIDLVRYADIWLRHKPGSDVALLMAMMKIILRERLHDSSFIMQRCENFETFKQSLDNFDLTNVETITGIPLEQIVEAALMYAQNSPSAILYAMGITQHSHGTNNVIAIANLAMLTGNIGKPGSGVNPLRGQNNVQGACDMGSLPNVCSGYQKVIEPAIRQKFKIAWGVDLPTEEGLSITEIIDSILQDKIKALYLIGENPILSDPDANHVQKALSNIDFFVAQDIFMNETVELAHVVLPGTSFAEKDGTFTNTERRIQRVRKAIDPIGYSRPDWLITCQIAQRMGAKGFDFERPSQIMDEIAEVTPSYGGISYKRLDKGGLQWPCPSLKHPGTSILHTQQFTRGKGRFIPLKYEPPAELPDKDYPLMLTTGRNLFQFHTGTMSRKVAGLNRFKGEEKVEIHPKDAKRLFLNDGDKVKVISRRGEITASIKISEASSPGVIFMTFHFAESPTNILTNPALDPVSRIPELKVCSVKIEKI